VNVRLDKYNIGAYNYRQSSEKWVISCGCGTVGLSKSRPTSHYKCEGCGNTNFLNITCGSRELHPYVDIIEKSARGFKAKRTNLSVMMDKEYNIAIKTNMVQVLLYDLPNNEVKLWKNGEEVELYRQYHNCRAYQRFFQGIDDGKFKSLVYTDNIGTLYDMAYEDLSYADNRSYGDRKFYRGLIRLFDYAYLQILANAGFPNVKRFKDRKSRWNTPKINTEGTSPKDIFKLPKFCLKYIREDENIRLYDVEQLQHAITKVDGNRLRELLEIVKDEATIGELCRTLDTLIEIHDTYSYNNIKKLTLYLFREIRMSQGIMSASTGATLLRDYVKMATKLNQEYEKYPKSLKKDHDVTMMNYKAIENELKRRHFKEKVETEDYKALEFKKKELKIISPTEMEDLIKEGSELSHCIASYIDRVIDDKCRIYFLRKVEDINTPMVSIEVANGNIRQARGSHNRKVSTDEKEFIKEWAKKNELVEAYYY
jgi:hypothetical protein